MFEKLKEQMSGLSKLPTPQKILMVGLIGTAVTGFLFLLYSIQKPSYLLLYSGLSSKDASDIIEELKRDKITYQVADGGSILVSGDQIYEVRMALAGKGLPQSGVGFEIFDKINIGTTEFVQKLNFQRALQGELARTISQLDGVERSRVHMTIPEDSLFIEDQKLTKASVFLKLRPGVKLHPQQIKGIAFLVSGAVEGLSTDNVTIMDTVGRVLTGPKDETSSSGLSSSQIEYEQGLEKNLEKNIQSMLEKVVGKEKVIARVSATLNLQQVNKTEEIYDPNITAVRSEQTSKEKSKGESLTASGVPGVASNVPGGEQGGSSGSSSQRQNETINYEINKVTRHVVEPVGTVEKLSVAVLLDGLYRINEQSNEREYVPRSAEEMSKYITLVKGVIGYDESRGDQVHVENIAFDAELDEGWVEGGESTGMISPMMIVILRYLLIALFGILFILFFIKPLMHWITTQSAGDTLPSTVAELESALANKMLPGISGNKQEQLKEEINKLIQENPSVATSLVKNWLNDHR